LTAQNCVKLQIEKKKRVVSYQAVGINIAGKAQYLPKVLHVRNNEDLIRRIGTKCLLRRWDTPTMKRFNPSEDSSAMTIRGVDRIELGSIEVGYGKQANGAAFL
jgi:hypothetical protein